ncbi:MAG: T9SS type A sorting domain-containing protein [Bacteroidia bacterium]
MKKLHLNLIALLIVVFGITTSKAQTPLTTALDFNVTDTKGVKHNLFDILKTGKYVCIDFFFTTCGPCIQSSPHFKKACTTYGCNTKDIYFMAVDLNGNNSNVIDFEKSYLDGNAGYPLISSKEGEGNHVCDIYKVNVYPTYVLISPDKKIVEQNMNRESTDFDAYFSKYSLKKAPCTVTGITENNAANDFCIYPNPASSNIIIASSTNKNVKNIKVYSILGKALINQSNLNNSDKFDIDITNLNTGVYFVEVTTENKDVFIKKFIKY